MLSKTLTITILIMAGAAFSGTAYASGRPSNQDDGRVKTEIDRTCQITPGAKIEVYSISGSVDVESTTGDQIEIHIVRTAPSQQDLDRARKMLIDCTGSGLQIREENGSEHRVNTRVALKVPSETPLSLHDINGRVRATRIHAGINLNNINGMAQVGDISGSSTISNVNGMVILHIVSLTQPGLYINNVNGSIEVHIADSVNANLRAENIGSGLYTDLPNVTIQGRLSSRNFQAQVGAGGPPISISSVNGKVHISAN